MPTLSPDRRPACGEENIVPRLFLGECYQHHYSGSSGVKVYYNHTKVPNYDTTSLGTPINPYPRQNAESAPNCSDNFQCDTTCNPDFCLNPCCGQVQPGLPFCNLPDPTEILHCDSGYLKVPVGRYFNCLSASNDTKSIAPCRDGGFKVVFAKKNKQGRHSYKSRILGVPDYWQWCCQCGYHNYDPNPDTTWYRSMQGNSNVTNVNKAYDIKAFNACGDILPNCLCCTDLGGIINCSPNDCITATHIGDSSKSSDGSNSTHVDLYGNFYVDSAISSSSEGNPDEAEVTFELMTEGNGDVNDLISRWCTLVGSLVDTFGQPTTIEGSGTSFHLAFTQTRTCCDSCGQNCSDGSYIAADMTIDSSAGTLTVTTHGPTGVWWNHCSVDGGCQPVELLSTDVYTFSDLAYSRTSFSFTRSESNEFIVNTTVNTSMATPYTSDQVYAEVVSLLGTWDIGDPAMYPWRLDGETYSGPYVSRHEGSSAPSLGAVSSIIQFTGSILGAPCSVPGVDKIWNPEAAVYDCCGDGDSCGEDSLCPNSVTRYIKEYGQYSTDGCHVPRATQWLNKMQQMNVPGGVAFVRSNMDWSNLGGCEQYNKCTGNEWDDLNGFDNAQKRVFDNAIYGAKYAETLLPRISYDYGEPAGQTRFTVSASATYCISASISRSLYLETVGAVDIETDDYVYVIGTPNLDGVWKARKDGTYNIFLRDYVISSSLQPTPSVPIIQNSGDANGMIGKLKYQPLAPAIYAHIGITSATRTTPITCSMTEPTWLVTGDQVTIISASGTNINGTWDVIVINNSLIALSGSVTDSGSYVSSSAQMYSTDAVDWKWFDKGSKGTYTVKKWNFNFRDVLEWRRLTSSIAFIEAGYQCNTSFAGPPCDPPPPSYLFTPIEPRTFQYNNCGLDQFVVSMSCEQGCIDPENHCVPACVYFSPNSESFQRDPNITTSINHGWGKVSIDDQYGSYWIGAVSQLMDGLWEKQPCPCNSCTDIGGNITIGCQGISDITETCKSILWREDDGSCEGDTTDPITGNPIKFYAKRKLVEAVCSPVSGSPDLAPGIVFGCLGTAELSSSCPPGNICNPPNYTDVTAMNDCSDAFQFTIYQTLPHLIYINELDCVCDSGRFSENYEEYGIACNETWVAPPP